MGQRIASAVIIALTSLAFSCGESASKSWKAMPLGTSAEFRDVFFADADRGWIAGGGYDIAGGLIGRTDDGGKTWRFDSGILSSSPSATGVSVQALHFFDRQRGVAAADGGKIYITRDGGENWGEVRGWTGATNYLFDLEFRGERTGWAIGLDGVLKTEDGGATWKPLTKETNEKEKIAGRAISLLDGKRGWLIGQYATALFTRDGGATWSAAEMPLPKRERLDFWDVFFLDDAGWICGDEGTLLQTTDGGRTWAVRDLGIPGVRSAPKLERIRRGNKVDVIDAGDRTPGLTLASIRFADAQNGWIVGFFANHGRSLILRTRDGGASWSIEADVEGEELRALHVVDGTHAWAVGARTRPGTQAIYVRDPSAK